MSTILTRHWPTPTRDECNKPRWAERADFYDPSHPADRAWCYLRSVYDEDGVEVSISQWDDGSDAAPRILVMGVDELELNSENAETIAQALVAAAGVLREALAEHEATHGRRAS